MKSIIIYKYIFKTYFEEKTFCFRNRKVLYVPDRKFCAESSSLIRFQKFPFSKKVMDGRAKNSTRLLSCAIYAPRYASPLYNPVKLAIKTFLVDTTLT
uniref:Uncharacterized protein n=1 Tax=Heterorhabditis bacteriophora TaxID=37862 RepID=A0A1I7WHY0_HETBA